MTDQRITRRVRAGGMPPTYMPPIQTRDSFKGSLFRRHLRALIPYAFFVVIFLVAGSFGLVIALGGKA